MWGWGKKAVVFMSPWICHYSTYTNTCIHTAHTQTCKERLSTACRQLNTHTNSKLATVLQKILSSFFPQIVSKIADERDFPGPIGGSPVYGPGDHQAIRQSHSQKKHFTSTREACIGNCSIFKIIISSMGKFL